MVLLCRKQGFFAVDKVVDIVDNPGITKNVRSVGLHSYKNIPKSLWKLAASNKEFDQCWWNR